MIRVLPQHIADRIAAGEVVERPASVLKELVENALDAGAQHLEIELESGGVRLLRVSDDGHGMDEQDLRLCVLPHATSKISDVEDLFRVASFGFRGEALPSIAAVARLEVVTRQAGMDHALELRAHAGRIEGPMPAARAVGTTMTVRDLFASVPARLRFLRQERAELAQCTDTLTRLLLPDTGISARMTHEGRLVLEVCAQESRRQRIAALLGEEIAAPLLELRAGRAGLQLEALIGPCELVRRTAALQWVFLNGRCIRDRSIAFAIKDAWRGLITPRDHPVAFLFIEMDPAQVDVNVHPQKSEVRFRDRDAVVGLIRSALRERLLAQSGQRPLQVTMPERVAEPIPEPRGTVHRAAEWVPQAASVPLHSTVPEVTQHTTTPHRGAHRCAARGRAENADQRRLPAQGESGPGRFLQVHRSWIVLESSAGLTILDQHALHERWLHEELLQRFESSEVESQALLVPVSLRRTPQEAALLLEHAHVLRRLGLGVEEFGGASLVVRTVPLALHRADPEELVDEALAALSERDAALPDSALISSLCADLACRAAVRFGDRLPDAEITALLEWWQAHPLLRNCPHGRPIAAGLSLQELELQFQRKK